MTRTFVDLHVLQTVPPSNLNRDDTGSPKAATYGGVRRARVSSQAWKRATRKEFKDLFDASELGLRTKRAAEVVADQIMEIDNSINPDTAISFAKDVLNAAFSNSKNKDLFKIPKDRKTAPAESEYLILFSRQQLRALAELATEAITSDEDIDKTRAKELVADKNSIDLALFGRMIADVSDLNVDASCQVAHALSTHAVDSEFDYFTAVDDQKAASADEDAGAGMIGTIEFNSATLYRYATINVDQLNYNLGDTKAAERAVRAFIEAFVRSMPTGKQNTFANRTLPEVVVIVVRDDQPVSYVGAFEQPVPKPTENGRGLMIGSAEQLVRYAQQVAKIYGSDGIVASWVVAMDPAAESLLNLGPETTFAKAVDGVSRLVATRLHAASKAKES